GLALEAKGDPSALADARPQKGDTPAADERAQLVDPVTGVASEVSVHDRTALAAYRTVEGPALIAERQTTTNVPAGFVVTVGSGGALILEDRT
ncbi:MAG: hypothetical protein AAGF49_03515, partial [Pseudomonadota bacterium]